MRHNLQRLAKAPAHNVESSFDQNLKMIQIEESSLIQEEVEAIKD